MKVSMTPSSETTSPVHPVCPLAGPSTPFRALSYMREQPGLSWDEDHQRYVVARYDDVVSALHHPEVFSSEPTVPQMPPRPQTHGSSAEFDVVMAQSQRTVTVGAAESVLDAVNRVGANVLSTCREGTCGSCEVRVIAGGVDHRDSVLRPQERAAGEFMMTCVSRASAESLTLDL